MFRDHAKLLWKRIPGSVKVSSPEIGELWEIGRRLWKRSFSEIYSLIEKGTWPPHIEPLLSQLNGNCSVYCYLIVFTCKSFLI